MPSYLTSLDAKSMQWAIKKGFLQRQPDRKLPALLSMDGFRGGCCFVPEHEWPDFLDLYAGDVQRGHRLYLSEQRTDVYAMHFDIDGLLMSAEQQKALLGLVQETLKCFYPTTTKHDRFEMLVLDTSAADAKEPHFAKGTTNLHVVLPRLEVTDEQAEPMARACVQRANLCIPDTKPPWDDVFDLRIYGPNGLRLIGSRKADTCKRCGKKKSDDCAECFGRGHVDKGRAYELQHVFGAAADYDVERLAQLQQNRAFCVRQCSIRRMQETQPTPGWCKYVGCPAKQLSNTQERMTAILERKMSAAERFERLLKLNAAETKKKDGSSKDVCVPRGSPEFVACEREIRAFAEVYRGLFIQDLFTTQARTYFRAKVNGDGMHTCHNLPWWKNERQHTSKKIYFVLSRKGIQQRCYSEHVEDRLNGPCATFATEPRPLQPDTLALLFPTTSAPRLGCFLSEEERALARLVQTQRRLFAVMRNPQLLEAKVRDAEPSQKKRRKPAVQDDESEPTEPPPA